MTDTITLTFTNTRPETAAAMLKGGVSSSRRYRDWPYILLSWAVVILIAGGGGFLALGLWILVFDQGDGLSWLLPACIMLALAVGHLTFRRMLHAQAEMTVRSKFGRLPQTLVFDAKGITQTNELATWQTAWRGVEFIHTTRHGISISISGIVIPIPDAAFEGGLTMQAVVDQLTKWHSAA